MRGIQFRRSVEELEICSDSGAHVLMNLCLCRRTSIQDDFILAHGAVIYERRQLNPLIPTP